MRCNIVLWGSAALFITLMSGCETQGPQPIEIESNTVDNRRYVTARSLNLRTCAGPECRVIGSLKRGDSGVILSEQAGWIQLDIDGRSTTGWVSGRYLSIQPVQREPDIKPAAKNTDSQPKMPEEGFATPVQAPPAPTEELATPVQEPPVLTEELANPEQRDEPAPVTTIEEEFAR